MQCRQVVRQQIVNLPFSAGSNPATAVRVRGEMEIIFGYEPKVGRLNPPGPTMPGWWKADTYGLDPYGGNLVRVQISPPVLLGVDKQRINVIVYV